MYIELFHCAYIYIYCEFSFIANPFVVIKTDTEQKQKRNRIEKK